MVFRERYHVIESVETVKYLGQILYTNSSDLPEVADNLQKTWRKWGRLSHILFHKGADPRTSRRLYIAVVKYVLLFGSEPWVATPHILRSMGSLHNWLSCRISVRIPWQLWNG